MENGKIKKDCLFATACHVCLLKTNGTKKKKNKTKQNKTKQTKQNKNFKT